MQVHKLDAGVVVTLDESEQFAFIPPQITEDQDWSPNMDQHGDPAQYATKVQTVTVFAEGPDEPSYFTVAGERIQGAGSAEDRFWEIPRQFTDSGPLPPHVRAEVEPIVPVVDRPATVIGGDYRYSYETLDGQRTSPSPTEADRQSQRRAHREQMDHVGETEAWDSRRRLPVGYGRGVGGDKWGRIDAEPQLLQVQPLNPHLPVPQALPQPVTPVTEIGSR